jgi:hypothetical protein
LSPVSQSREEAVSLSKGYQPKEFVTTALQNTRVKLTWDEDDQDRVKVTQRKFSKEDLKSMDFKAYLASESESEVDSEDEAAMREKYRALLNAGNSDDEGDATNNQEMEITFAPGLGEMASKLLDKKREKETHKNETVFETNLRKQKEKKKARKYGSKSGERAFYAWLKLMGA